MKKYNITVDGTTYEVEVDEVGAPVQAVPQEAAPTQQQAAAPAAQEAPKASSGAAISAGATTVEAPMPGKILDIKVIAGQAVKEGEILLILEAMKMENEIVAPQDGTIDAIVASVGSTVDAGEVLLSLK